MKYIVRAANLRTEMEVESDDPKEVLDRAREILRANSIETKFASFSVREAPDERND